MFRVSSERIEGGNRPGIKAPLVKPVIENLRREGYETREMGMNM